MDEPRKTQGKHNAILENREKLLLSGVTEIDSFDDRTVILYTQLGELVILGRELHVQQLSTASGEVQIKGEIRALRYGDRDRTAPQSFLGRLLR